MKILKYTVLAIFALIWLAALNRQVFKIAAELSIARDGYHYGDLYRLSNLPQFKEPHEWCPVYQAPPINGSHKDVNLFIIGDSFAEDRIHPQNFPVKNYQFLRRSQVINVKADTNVINVLMIECVEREFREYLNTPVRNLQAGPSTYVSALSTPSGMQKLDQAFSADVVSERFEMLLFHNDAILKLKELKASFNQHFFGRVNGKVKLVKNESEIVYLPDVDTPRKTSSFTPVSNGEIDTLVNNLVEAKKLAQSIGFDEVILSIVPNKVSVVMPEYGSYNHLIEKVYSHPRLNLPVIDVLSDFQKMESRAYLLGDSHWTCDAQQIWIDKTNLAIRNIVERKSSNDSVLRPGHLSGQLAHRKPLNND